VTRSRRKTVSVESMFDSVATFIAAAFGTAMTAHIKTNHIGLIALKCRFSKTYKRALLHLEPTGNRQNLILGAVVDDDALISAPVLPNPRRQRIPDPFLSLVRGDRSGYWSFQPQLPGTAAPSLSFNDARVSPVYFHA